MRLAIIALVACKSNPPNNDPPPPATGSGAVTCEQQPFAGSTPVPEASGAAWIDGKLVVISDSGNHGAYGIVDPDTGDTIEQGQLPIADSTDDFEGLASRGNLLYGLTSPGWILVWRRVDHGFELVDGPYALGPVDLPNTHGVGDKPPKGDGMVCDKRGTNCGRNYEGLCLAPQPTGDCTGYALSKADGHLYCLTGEHLTVHHDRAIAVDRPGVAADCAYSPDGTLWAADNLFGLSQVFQIEGDRAVPFAQIGEGFPEVIAVRGDLIYRMSDTGGSPSLMAKFRCTRAAR